MYCVCKPQRPWPDCFDIPASQGLNFFIFEPCRAKNAFKYMQNVQIQIILGMHKVSSRAQLFKASLA